MLAVVVVTSACSHAASVKPDALPTERTFAGAGAQKAQATAQLDALAKQVSEYEMQNGHCPPDMNAIIKTSSNDPWGHPIAFVAPTPEEPHSGFVSAGPDGDLLTADDITVTVNCSER